MLLMRDKQKHKHRLERRSKKNQMVAGTGFSRTKHQLEQRFGLPSVGKETLHDVSASATKHASASAAKVLTTFYESIWHPHGLIARCTIRLHLFFDRR